MSKVPLHDMIKPLGWLLGRWRADAGGKAHYPTMTTMEYGEEVEFFHVGQPNIQFSFYSWDAASKRNLHRETGFIRVQPGTSKLAFISAHNVGVAEVQEGEFKENELKVETTGLARLSFGKEPATKKVGERLLDRSGAGPMGHAVGMAHWSLQHSKVFKLSAAMHEAIKPLSWLLGRWRAEGGGKGIYPTITSFEYGEELHFFYVGQPSVQFTFYSWYAESKEPLHREIGFIRVQPDTNKVALMGAHNIGYSEVQEGEVSENELRLETEGISRMSFGRDPPATKLLRVIRRTGGNLEQVVSMETAKTPLTEHLRISYKKVE